MPIHLLREKATAEQIREMLAEHSVMVKIAIDVRRHILAGGGKMHADCEAVLLNDGSGPDDVWGANWYPADQSIEFESLINIRPRLGNRNIILQNEELCAKVETVTRSLLGTAQ
ncbi:MAG: DUF5674 family protein [Anaerolineales bacterium]